MPNDGHERLYDYVLLSGVGFGGNSCARVMKRT
jgi:3-oxoacyl-(acyl-carrier-protein) synthase